MTIKETCEVVIVHEDVVERVQTALPNLEKVVPIFKALADDTRLKIAYSLMLEKEMCVCDVAAVIGSSNATASHHLRYLKEHALAKSKRRGRMVYYSLADNHIKKLVSIGRKHALEGESHDD